MTISSVPNFETTFNVPLTCDACVKDVTGSLRAVSGIASVSVDLASQMVSVKGNAAPSLIVKAIHETGRDAILRGSGTANSAAVCILETHAPVKDYVKGLVRMVQVAPQLTVFDITIRGLHQGMYTASIRESGDISKGPESTGELWEAHVKQVETKPPRAVLGVIEVATGGVGSLFVDKPIEVWELIGRGIVVSTHSVGTELESLKRNDENCAVGVIARSAGVWDNTKTVCSCSGKTVWEERKEQSDRGMM